MSKDEDIIEVESGTLCFNKEVNWMQNEATQDLRDFIRQLIDSLVNPFIRKVAILESKLEHRCAALEKERTELKELTTYIKQYELVKEQEIKNLSDRIFLLEQTLQDEKDWTDIQGANVGTPSNLGRETE
jgi:predicted RNase H-like nuclease (RuvC/YqgF family)